MICDYLRMVGMNADDPNQIEDVMARELKKTLHEELHGAHALQTMADGLPALGIVAAVLGVIKTMSHIDRPPAVLGAMIGSALAAHSSACCWPMAWPVRCASRLKSVVEEEAKYYEVIRAVLVTHLHGNAPQVSVESGRKMVPNEHMPSFLELEEAVQSVQIELAPPQPSAAQAPERGRDTTFRAYPPPFPRLGEGLGRGLQLLRRHRHRRSLEPRQQRLALLLRLVPVRLLHRTEAADHVGQFRQRHRGVQRFRPQRANAARRSPIYCSISARSAAAPPASRTDRARCRADACRAAARGTAAAPAIPGSRSCAPPGRRIDAA